MSERIPPENTSSIGLSLLELTGLFSGEASLGRVWATLARRASVLKTAGVTVVCRDADDTLTNPSTRLPKRKSSPKGPIVDLPDGHGKELLHRPDIILFVSSLIEITERPVDYDGQSLQLYRRIQHNNPDVILVGGTLSLSMRPPTTSKTRPTTTITLYTIDAATNRPTDNVARLTLDTPTGIVQAGLDSLAQLYPASSTP